MVTPRPDPRDPHGTPDGLGDDQLGDDQLDAVEGGSDQAYNVVTWDPRGEFASGGVLDARPPI